MCLTKNFILTELDHMQKKCNVSRLVSSSFVNLTLYAYFDIDYSAGHKEDSVTQ